MDASRVIERVQKLVAMTTSPNEEEARTSAFLACKMIREHGLQVVSSGAAAQRTERAAGNTSPGYSPTASGGFQTVEDVRDYWLRQRQRRQQEAWEDTRRAASEERQEAAARRATRGPAGAPRWRLINVGHAGKCLTCGTRIEPGTESWWMQGVGLRCCTCGCGPV